MLYDYSTFIGARMLAHQIEDYWRCRGFVGIKTQVIDEGARQNTHTCGGHIVWGVRSNIGPDGYPPREWLQ